MADENAADIAAARDAGRRAADLGLTLDELWDDLDDPAVSRRRRARNAAAVRAAVTAWSDRTLELARQMGCENPLTGLATMQHLRTQLSGIYRLAEREGTAPDEAWAFVMLEVAPGRATESDLARALTNLEASSAMRRVFSGDEVIAQTGPRRIVALVPRDRVSDDVLEVLDVVLRGSLRGAEFRRWVEPLAPDVHGLVASLAGLTR